MEFIVNFFQGVVNTFFSLLKFLLALPFKIANFFIVLMGILATAFLLWWIYSVPMPPAPDVPPVAEPPPGVSGAAT
jgi:hypothetical protein